MYPSHRRTAFTLIELLVVVAIIALLISILLPSLSRAREQAKTVKCLANLKNMGLAAAQYLNESSELPWALRRDPNNPATTFSVWSELVYAGAMPSKTNAEFNANVGAQRGFSANAFDVYKVPPRLRPLNRYLATDVSWDAEANPRPTTPREVPAEIPDFFKCPSDRTPFLPSVQEDNPRTEPDVATPTWEFFGNSYAVNWYWPYYYYKTAPGNQPPYNADFLAIMGVAPNLDTVSLGNLMMRNKDGRFSAEFISFSDNDVNYALEGARPPTYSGAPWVSQPKRVQGWHGQFGRHSAAFLDGRAQNRAFDTRFVLGDGWTIWPNKPWNGDWTAYNDKAPTP